MAEKAVIYLRVSTGKQVDGASLDTQRLMCQNWATSLDIVVEETFVEGGASAKTLDRPVLQQLLDYCEKNKEKISYVVTFQTDRVSRDLADFLFLRKHFRKLGIEVKNISSSSGVNTATDDLVQNLEAVIAEHDNRQKSERVTANMERHAKGGYRMSKAPYGLRNVRDALNRSTVEPVPDIADKIADVLTKYSTGAYTIAELLKYTHSVRLTSNNGKPLSHQTLSKLLRQPLYAGLDKSKHTGDQLVKSSFDGIIPQAVFYRNQDLLRKNKNTAAVYKTINPLFPLRRFARCAQCNSPLRGSSPTGGSGESYPRYHCTGCSAPSVATETVHKNFEELLDQVTPSGERLALIKEVIVRSWKKQLDESYRKAGSLSRKIDELNHKKSLAIDKLINGQITATEKDTYITSVESEISSAQTQLDSINKLTGLKEDAIDYTLENMARVKKIWNDSSPEARITLQELVFPKGLVYDLEAQKFGTSVVNSVYSLQSKNPKFLVNSWGEIWKTFEDIDARLVELGIDEIMEGDDV